MPELDKLYYQLAEAEGITTTESGLQGFTMGFNYALKQITDFKEALQTNFEEDAQC